jgi:hypothetical protein
LQSVQTIQERILELTTSELVFAFMQTTSAEHWRILAVESKSIDFVSASLEQYGFAYSVDTVPDFRLPYDVVIGKIDHTLWSTVKDTASVVIMEFPDQENTKKYENRYTCSRNGNIFSVLLKFGGTSSLDVRYSCEHRSTEPVRFAECAPCEALTGESKVPIFRCSLFDCECSVASREVAGEGKLNLKTGKRSRRALPCTVCRDRVPLPLETT